MVQLAYKRHTRAMTNPTAIVRIWSRGIVADTFTVVMMSAPALVRRAIAKDLGISLQDVEIA